MATEAQLKRPPSGSHNALRPAATLAIRWLSFLFTLTGALLCATVAVAPAQAVTVQYVYDEIGRLVAVIDPDGETTQYVYDDVGNILSVSRRSSAEVSILSFSPTRGEAGTAVTLYGSGFSATPSQNTVAFSGVAAAVTAATATSIVVIVPSGAVTGPINVSTPTGSATSATSFVVEIPQPPQILSVSPAVVVAGDTLTITGSSIRPTAADNQVVVNAAPATIANVAAPDSVSVQVPVASGGKVTLTTPFGSATSHSDVYIVPSPYATTDVSATGRIAIDAGGQAISIAAGKLGLLLFDGEAGAASVRVTVSSASTSGTLTVYQPDGSVLGTPLAFGAGAATLDLPALPATGSYTALLRFNGNSGSGTVTAWSGELGSGELALNSPLQIRIPIPGLAREFTFNAGAGDNFGVELKDATLAGTGSITVYRPDGGQLNSFTFNSTSNYSVRFSAISQTGVYRVVVRGPANATGTVQLTLWKDVDGGTLTRAAVKTIALAYRNQWARMTFNGTAGENLGLEVNRATLGGSGNIVVVRPDGGQLNAFSFVSSSDYSVRLTALTQTGTYTVLVQPSSNLTGTIDLTLWKDVEGQVLAPAQQATTTLSYRNQWARLTFAGSIGDNLGLEVNGVTLGGSGNIVVLRPDGGQLNALSFVSNSDYSVRLNPLAQVGTYTILVQPSSNLTGSIRLTLWKDAQPGTLDLETPKSVALAYRNQWARMTFSGTAGENLGLEVSKVTLGGSGNIVIVRPDGGQLNALSFVSSSDYSVRLTSLTQTGTYTVVVQPSSNLTGTIDLTLWKDVEGQVLTPAQPAATTLSYRNQWARLTFAGSIGDNLGMEVNGVTLGGSGNIVVLRPDGGQLNALSFVSSSNYSVRLTQLAQAGTYTVLVQPSSNLTGSIQLTLWKDAQPGTFELETPKSVALAYRNQWARMTFSGTAGENLGLEVSKVTLGGSGNIVIVRPDGGQLNALSFASSSDYSVRLTSLTQTGTYTVLVQPSSNLTGTIDLTLWKDVSGPLSLGVPSRVQFKYRNQHALLSFTGAVGENLSLNVSDVTLPSNSSVSVLTPSASQLTSAVFGASGLTLNLPALPTDGTYSVRIVPPGNATGAATIALSPR